MTQSFDEGELLADIDFAVDFSADPISGEIARVIHDMLVAFSKISAEDDDLPPITYSDVELALSALVANIYANAPATTSDDVIIARAAEFGKSAGASAVEVRRGAKESMH